jgi:MFS transporter, DHA1 family, tetracycline resistance protein
LTVLKTFLLSHIQKIATVINISKIMVQKRNSALIFIFITMLIDVIGFGIVIPIFPKLLTGLIHGTLSDAATIGGWLMFSYAIVQFFFAPIIGGLSDKYGRRPVILASLFGFGIDYILLGFAPTITWLFIGRIIAGITGASFTAAGAYIADVSEPEKRAQNFGLIGAAFGLGFIIGPALGGALAELGKWLIISFPDFHFLGYDIKFWGMRLPFFVSALLTLINWLYGFFILPESLKPENRRNFDWKRANPVGTLINLARYPIILRLIIPLFLILVAGFSTQSVWSYYTMYRFGWSEGWVAASLVFVGLMAAIVQGLLTRILIPKLGINKSIYYGLIISAIGYALFALAYEGWMMFVVTAISALGGISMPALQGIMSNEVPANEQGELRGAITSITSITAFTGPPLMTWLFSYFTNENNPIHLPGAPYWLGAVLVFISIIVIYQILSKEKTKVI